MKNVSYVHFDTEMSKKEARDYLKNIDSHQYLPFINYTVDKKKWDGNHNKTGETRTISVASIKDNYVYQHFNNIISSKYEKYIDESELKNVVCAYRKGQHKSNIHYAHEALNFIMKSKDAKIFIGDISNFFDNLDHKLLKECLKEVLLVNELDDVTYKMLKSLEKASYIEIDDIIKFLNSKGVYIHIYVYNGFSGNKNKYAAMCKFCKKHGLRTIVKKEWFKELKNSYLKPGKEELKVKNKGIVQGSSVSSTLSNVYMINVDKKIVELLKDYDYIYRRYCDDFIIVIRNIDDEIYTDIIDKIKVIISEVKLELKDSKIQKFSYKKRKITNLNGTKKFIQFLGFELHDNYDVLIRRSTLDRFKNKVLKVKRQVQLHL